MTRPKTYTDDDVINIATQLISKGKKPSGWHIKEALGRGKISSIQADLERLIQDGHISVEEPKAPDAKEAEATLAFLSYDLPAELQDLLAKREKELCKVMREITTALNNKANEHYETLIAIRVRDLDAKYNLTYRAKEQAEADFFDIEERLKKQVEEKEQLEEKIEELECELAESRQSHSELLQHNLQLTSNLTSVAEKYEILQGTYQNVNEQLTVLQNEHTAITVKLDCTQSENESLQSRIAELSAGYDEAKKHLAETKAKLTASQDALHTSENFVDDLRKSNNELTNRLKVFENPLCKTGEIALSPSE
ncbi:TPA: DNA-binding protein [Vibrio parahaemolyticus]